MAVRIFLIYPHELTEFSVHGVLNPMLVKAINHCTMTHRHPVFFFFTGSHAMKQGDKVLKGEMELLQDTERLVIQECEKVMLCYDKKITGRMMRQMSIATELHKEIVRFPQ